MTSVLSIVGRLILFLLALALSLAAAVGVFYVLAGFVNRLWLVMALAAFALLLVSGGLTWLLTQRPALSLLAGSGWVEPWVLSVPAAFAKRKKAGRREYLRARLTPEGAAEVFHSEGSGLIGGLSWADGLVELPEAAAEIAPGMPVRYWPFAGFGLG